MVKNKKVQSKTVKSTKTVKAVKTIRKVKTVKSKKSNKNKLFNLFGKRRSPAIILSIIFIGILTVAGFTIVQAQTPVPIQTFTTSYKGLGSTTAAALTKSASTPNQACTKTQTIYGAKPVATGNYPVLIYVHGATADWSGNKEGQRFVQLAAAQGFIALAFTYTSGSSTLNQVGLQGHAYCMFDQSHAGNGLTAACATAGADCSKGVLVAGFSQGGAISVVARNNSPLVKAVWTMGVSAYIYPSNTIPTDAIAAPGGTRLLPNNKLMLNIGQSSNLTTKNLIPQDLPSLKALSGVNCGTSYQCVQADGSGYYVVQNSEIKDKVADHCYWMKVNAVGGGLSCTINPTNLDPGFQPPSTSTWSMTRNLDWLRSQMAS